MSNNTNTSTNSASTRSSSHDNSHSHAADVGLERGLGVYGYKRGHEASGPDQLRARGCLAPEAVATKIQRPAARIAPLRP